MQRGEGGKKENIYKKVKDTEDIVGMFHIDLARVLEGGENEVSNNLES